MGHMKDKIVRIIILQQKNLGFLREGSLKKTHHIWPSGPSSLTSPPHLLGPPLTDLFFLFQMSTDVPLWY